MRMVIALMLGLIISSSPAFAQELFQYETAVELHQDMSSDYEEKFIFSNSTSDSFIITVEGIPKNISVESPVRCDQTEKSWGVQIDCDTSGVAGESFSINVKYSIEGRVEAFDGKYIFRDSVKSPAQTQNMILMVKVPEGMGLINKAGESVYEQPFLPSTGFVATDGRRPIVTWEKGNVVAGDGIDASIAFEKIGFVAYDERATILFAALIVLVLGVSAFYFFYWRKKTSVKVVMPILKHDEKSVMESLIKHGGKGVNQKIITGESGYSKAKVSKVLKSLQERGVLRLERIGRKNKVHIVREFKKEEQKTSGNNPK